MREVINVMNYFLLLWFLFTRPTWAWQLVWFSSYNPANSYKRHVKRFQEYEQYELPLVEVLQRTSKAREEINYILEESRRFVVTKDCESSLIPARFDASIELGQICYSLVRLTKPSNVVETGVGRGVTSHFILRALEENRKGRLYSIELPPLRLGARKEVGKFVPASLVSRWRLIFGPGVREMKKLQGEIKNIDIFVHDSNHSYLNQLAEYQIALKWLKKDGILISDDVENDALLEAIEKYGGKIMVTKQSKPRYIGIIIKS